MVCNIPNLTKIVPTLNAKIGQTMCAKQNGHGRFGSLDQA